MKRKTAAALRSAPEFIPPNSTAAPMTCCGSAAGEILATGGSVVVDASFARRRQRELFRETARAGEIPFFMAIAACDREVALRRLDARQVQGQDVSDGRREIFDDQAALFEAPTAAEDALMIDTLQSVAYNVQLLLCALITRAGIRP